jgi:hypothetical protein
LTRFPWSLTVFLDLLPGPTTMTFQSDRGDARFITQP